MKINRKRVAWYLQNIRAKNDEYAVEQGYKDFADLLSKSKWNKPKQDENTI